jgi:hypothetical protein
MTTRSLTLEPAVVPVAERDVALAVLRAVTEPTVISPLKKESPVTATEALAVVVLLPAEPDAVDEIEPARAIDPSPGNAKLPPPEALGGAETPPPVAPPPPGTDTEMPNASALGTPTLVAEGAPAELVSARTPRMPSRNECRLATAPDYWPRLRHLLDTTCVKVRISII